MRRSRGGLTTKVRALVDARGLPIKLVLTAGPTHDSQTAAVSIEASPEDTVVLADKGYDADRIRAAIEARGAAPNIPAKSNRTQRFCFSRILYRQRNLIERFHAMLKQFPANGNPLREARSQLPYQAHARIKPSLIK